MSEDDSYQSEIAFSCYFLKLGHGWVQVRRRQFSNLKTKGHRTGDRYYSCGGASSNRVKFTTVIAPTGVHRIRPSGAPPCAQCKSGANLKSVVHYPVTWVRVVSALSLSFFSLGPLPRLHSKPPHLHTPPLVKP